MIDLARKSPSGELFSQCAAAVKPMEDCALLLGRLIDECREITMLPLTAENRELVLAALKTPRGSTACGPILNTGCAR